MKKERWESRTVTPGPLSPSWPVTAAHTQDGRTGQQGGAGREHRGNTNQDQVSVAY